MVERTLKTRFPNFKPTTIPALLVKVFLIGSSAWLFGWWFVPYVIRQLISSKLVISPELSPEFYAAWEKPPVPFYMKIYIFNVTNPEEVEAGGLPKLSEIGPYVFQGKRWRENVSLDDSADTATYIDRARFHFHKDMSGNRTLDDVVTLINVPYAAAAIKIQRDFPWPLRHVALMILRNYGEPLFVQKTVEQVLFKGWKVPFLEQIEEEIGLTMIANNTFGFFVELNNTKYGPTTIKRGLRGDTSDFGKIVKWKGESTLNFWGERNSTCNKLQGTDGTIFPPFVTKDRVVSGFNAEVCRSVDLTYHNEMTLEGIQGYRFTAPAALLEDSRVSQENRCYCDSVDTEPEKCLMSGAVDLGPCREGAPVAISKPHFLDGDTNYVEQIAEGVKPDRNLHEIFIDVEPLTGVILEASKKVQLNLILKRVPSIGALRKVNEMIFPLVWADECATLVGEELTRFKFYLSLIHGAHFGSKCIASAVAIIAIIALLRHQMVSNKQISYTAEEKIDGDASGKFLE